MKVLIAEDDPIVCRVLERLLGNWGYDFHACTSGAEALKYLVEEMDQGLALLDWMIPDMEGIEICRKIRRDYPEKNIYCILVTGRTDKSSLITGIDAGADDYIMKPIDKSELQVRLRAGERIVRSREELTMVNQHLEMVVHKRTRDLEETLKEAKHASAMKSMFLANMSHEIRTPMNGIVSYVELLLHSELSEEQREDLLTIRNCVHSLRTIINDILDLSKIEAGKLIIDHSPFNLRGALKEIRELFAPQAAEGEVNFEIELGPDLPESVTTDRVRIQQIITNLVGNAIKFTPKGGSVSLVLRPETRDLLKCIGVEVRDSGVGIPEEKQKAIFDSFEQGDASTTRRFGGTGLGLAICKKLCDLMGGEITLSSEVGKGSIFKVILPIEFKVAAETPVANVDGLVTGAETPQRRRILLAEDNLINQRAMVRILRAAGHEVVGVGDGVEALEKALSEEFDIILMDIQMPEMDGVEVVRRVRNSDSPTAKIPIVALTANALESDRALYKEVGMNRVVAKPVDYPELYKVIDELTSDKGGKL